MVLNNYGTITVQTVYADQVVEQQLLKNAGIPKDLSTDEAIKLWTICQEKGWIDADLQPKGITQEQAAIIADAMGAKLGLLFRWSDFEELWKIKHLAALFNRGYNHNESLQSFVYEVELAITRA